MATAGPWTTQTAAKGRQRGGMGGCIREKGEGGGTQTHTHKHEVPGWGQKRGKEGTRSRWDGVWRRRLPKWMERLREASNVT